MCEAQTKYEAQTNVDVLALGGMVLRFDSGEGTLDACPSFNVHVSGAEYNPVFNLTRAFGIRTGIATAIVSNHTTGQRILAAIPRGMEVFAKDFQHDGVTGPNHAMVFSDAGFGDRGPEVYYNRANEAAALLKPGDFDWEKLLVERSVRWVHTGGLFASLSDSAAQLQLELVQAAKKKPGTTVSYDLNYRAKLWGRRGGTKAAHAALDPIMHHVDVLLGNEEDMEMSFGIKPDNQVNVHTALDSAAFASSLAGVRKFYPNIRVAATSNRRVNHTNSHDWGMFVWMCDEEAGSKSEDGVSGHFYTVPQKPIAVRDRIGGGDGAAAGLIAAMLADEVPAWAVDGNGNRWSRGDFAARMAWAHGALVATTPGDTTMVSFERVKKYALGGSARVER